MAGKKYEVYVHKGRPIWKIFTGILFSHFGLFILSIGYGALGAYIFILLELPAEELRYETKLNKTKDVEASIDYLKNIFYFYATNVERYNYSVAEYRAAVYADLDTLKKFVVKYHNEYNYDMTDDWEYDWDFPKAWLFCITIMTTVGYGHISPKTDGGKLFCILYALIGMPLLIVFSVEIGDLMADAFRWFYSRICCRWCRVRRRDNELPPTLERTKVHISRVELARKNRICTWQLANLNFPRFLVHGYLIFEANFQSNQLQFRVSRHDFQF